MGLLSFSVTLTNVATQTFTFPDRPDGLSFSVSYSLDLDESSGVVASVLTPFTSSGGTTTGALNCTDTVTGTANFVIIDM